LVLDATYATQQLPKNYTYNGNVLTFTDSKPRWYTLAAYFNYQANEKNRWSLRLEDFIDQSGFKSALGSALGSNAAGKYIQVQSATLTYGYMVDSALELRAEARIDRANLPGSITGGLFYSKSDGNQTTNNGSSGSIEAVYKF
jgi:hypothetical protein